MELPVIYCKKGKEAALLRQHPWIFSGAIEDPLDTIAPGMVVQVKSHTGKHLCIAHFEGGSIIAKVISVPELEINENFWYQKLLSAYQVRERLGLIHDPATNCYRLVFGEGDFLPGLIIDIYHHTAVIQCHSMGMYHAVDAIQKQLKKLYKDQLKCIYHKSQETIPAPLRGQVQDEFLYGEITNTVIQEHHCNYEVNWVQGQKTGFFLDQHDNRRCIMDLAANQKVLNCFAYTGGFSIAALKGGASSVTSVEVSKTACELLQHNLALNQYDGSNNPVIQGEVMPYFREESNSFDLVIVDPPAFAKSISKRHNALMGYKHLNEAALRKVKKGGLLATFSCSQVVTEQFFKDIILASAISSGRQIRILKVLHAGADHPASLFHPEGNYLKGLLLYVEN